MFRMNHIRALAFEATEYDDLDAARTAVGRTPETDSVMDDVYEPLAGENEGDAVDGFVQLRSDHKANIYFVSDDVVYRLECIFGYA